MCVSKLCVNKLCANKWCVNQLCVKKMCVSKLCVNKLCVDKLCGSKLCVSKLFLSNLCVRKERREAAGVTRDDGGSAQPKTRILHKAVGKKSSIERNKTFINHSLLLSFEDVDKLTPVPPQSSHRRSHQGTCGPWV